MFIKINNLTKIYGNQKAIDNISFEIKRGEIMGFLGPNGAGKSTTMKILTHYISPDAGAVEIDGNNALENPELVKRNIGYLPESNPLYLDMPIIDFLKYTAKLQGVIRSEINNRVRLMIEKCGLGYEKHKKIGELSKGYKQRVGLAQALIHDPEILILDEPTTGLDPNQIVEIRKLIKEIGREKTIILSTHILPEVEATCDRIMIINRGKIVADGTANSLRNNSKGSTQINLTLENANADDVISKIKSLTNIADIKVLDLKDLKFEIHSSENTEAKKRIFKLAVENNWIITDLSSIQTKLEDIFRDLTLNTK